MKMMEPTELISKWISVDLSSYKFQLDFVVGLAMCCAAGFFIGNEREKQGKPAGISTHTLVLIGSLLYTTLSQLHESTPAIAAYIVSGIGFLGAGVIMKNSSNKISNLTTAAGIWVSAAVGMSIGYHQYLIALAAVIAASVGLHKIPHPNKNKKQAEATDDSPDAHV